MTVKNMPSGADSSPEERRIGALGDALKASDIADTRYLPITTFVEKNALFSHFRNAASPVSAGFDDRPATTSILRPLRASQRPVGLELKRRNYD